jgi:hypothetical protein
MQGRGGSGQTQIGIPNLRRGEGSGKAMLAYADSEIKKARKASASGERVRVVLVTR